MKLSVIVAVFNEKDTVRELLTKLVKVKAVEEVVVINDGSTDETKKELEKLMRSRSLKEKKKIQIFHKDNGGKGSAVRHGLTKVTGDYVLIQDADLEYDPEDIPSLLEQVEKGKAEVVYGSRFLGPHSNLLFWHRFGNGLLNFLVNILYNTTLSDMETCYKLLPTRMIKSLDLKANAFDLEPEITCKLLKRGVRIFEIPISYVGRDFSEGKKITWQDGLEAFRVILSLRLR